MFVVDSNTTLVKVKLLILYLIYILSIHSNTTFVKVKFTSGNFGACGSNIQIQHLLKLNTKTIGLYPKRENIQIQHLLKLNGYQNQGTM